MIHIFRRLQAKNVETQLLVVASIIALAFGLLIMTLSFFRASSSRVVTTTSTTNRRLYWSGPIRPDHLFFPVVNGVARLRLNLKSPDERVYGHLKLAEQRQDDIQVLLEEGVPDQAVSALVRAQFHLLQASSLTEYATDSSDLRNRILGETQQMETFFSKIQQEFPDNEASKLSEASAMFEQLKMSLE